MQVQTLQWQGKQLQPGKHSTSTPGKENPCSGCGFCGCDGGNKSKFNLISSKLFTGSDSINTHSFLFYTQGWKTDYRTSSSLGAGKPQELIGLIFTNHSEPSCKGHPGSVKPWHAASTQPHNTQQWSMTWHQTSQGLFPLQDQTRR